MLRLARQRPKKFDTPVDHRSDHVPSFEVPRSALVPFVKQDCKMSSSAASEMRDRCIKVRDTCTAACVVHVLGSASSEICKHMHLLSERDHETKRMYELVLTGLLLKCCKCA
jgi:hypothetical protein